MKENFPPMNDCLFPSFSPECMPHPRDEHEAHILLLIWFVTWGMVLVFLMTRVDWKNDPKLLLAIVRYTAGRIRARSQRQTNQNGRDNF
jgi:hypothetical protein